MPAAAPSGGERRIRLAPDARSPGLARRMLTAAMTEAGLTAEGPDGAVVDTVVLLASELCENSVLHAGTEFEVAVSVDVTEVVVTVSDRGAGPLEQHLAQPRRRYGRAAAHGRGLALLSRLATSWGTRHDQDGTHHTWFSVAREPAGTVAPVRPVAPPTAGEIDPPTVPIVPGLPSERVRRLLHLPSDLAGRLDATELVAELVRRLWEVLDADAVVVEVDEGDGAGSRIVARSGPLPEVGPSAGTGTIVALPTTAPLRGSLVVRHHPGAVPPADAADLAELVAQRVGMAVESAWLREVDQRRRAWLAYLADTSELLGQSLDVELTVAVVPQVVVPRLGAWCAVHLVDDAGRLQLAALTHADEERLPELRTALEPAGLHRAPELRGGLAGLLTGRPGPVRFTVPTDGVAVPLTSHGTTTGTLSVGRPIDRPHRPEDVALVADVARRAALAVHNAQVTAAHVRVSQALQQALLPRALPVVPGLDLAAQYLPASTGSDVGGDFYDVYPVGPGRWLVAIGDVCGTGAAAAARTGLLRDVLRVLVREGRPLVRAIELLNDVMLESGGPLQFATLAAALVEMRSQNDHGGEGGPELDLALVLAGHLQPLLVHPDGRVELLGQHGTAVGLVERVELTCTSHRLGPGDTLLLYTDGVTERRRGDEQFGIERLRRAGGVAAGRPAARLLSVVRAALDRFTRDPHDDDIALLAVRAEPSA